MDKQMLLKKRAEKLAGVDVVKEESNVFEFVLLTLGKETYAIPSKYIQEVYPCKEITPLPCVPPFVIGLLNIRRKICSVISLPILFGMSHQRTPGEKVILIKDLELAFLVDGISGVRSYPITQLQTSLPVLAGVQQDFLKGITEDGIIVLDVERLLADARIKVGESNEK